MQHLKLCNRKKFSRTLLVLTKTEKVKGYDSYFVCDAACFITFEVFNLMLFHRVLLFQLFYNSLLFDL